MVSNLSSDYFKLLGGDVKKMASSEFTDARGGANDKDLTSKFNALARAANNKLLKKYSDKSIDRIIDRILASSRLRGDKEITSKTGEIIGVSQERLAKDLGLDKENDKLVKSTSEWISKLRDDTLEKYNESVLDAILKGRGVDYVAEQYGEVVGQRKRHAEMVARTQIAQYNSMLSKLRAEKLGIDEAIWVTGGDSVVRKSHADRDGKRFKLNKGCYSDIDKKWLLPGIDYLCRCTYKMIIPEDL